MGLQGLDRAAAPAAAQAKALLGALGGGWWNVYIGGPSASSSGWTPQLVQDYVRAGINRFMLTYAGQQRGGVLVPHQAQADAAEACDLSARFGFPRGAPVCLDIEGPEVTGPFLDYIRAWCLEVRRRGNRPGVYANPGPLQALAQRGGWGKELPDFVWVASWFAHGREERDPHQIPGFDQSLWKGPGQRAWQYAGGPASVQNVDVDISVADEGCLASWPGVGAQALQMWPGVFLQLQTPYMQGETVGAWQGRLNQLGWKLAKDSIYGPLTDSATREFQTQRKVSVDGIVGPETWQAAW